MPHEEFFDCQGPHVLVFKLVEAILEIIVANGILPYKKVQLRHNYILRGRLRERAEVYTVVPRLVIHLCQHLQPAVTQIPVSERASPHLVRKVQ